MTRYRPIALLAALLILGLCATPDASAQKATIEGYARAEEGGAPVQFALERLVDADSRPLPLHSSPQGMTNPDGRYWFDGVAPGRYCSHRCCSCSSSLRTYRELMLARSHGSRSRLPGVARSAHLRFRGIHRER